ncbi:MAG: ferrous iron transport protein B [Clostridia bacterium]|nr:ferrous iron transport protein B [Clostridia bacterium]
MNICLVGNQNCGKTTLFNALTGMNQKIGNWPGVTIEKKVGIIKETNFELVDLPGIYSLNPYTEEEKISRDFILTQRPEIIINIIDATCLERSLYLTTQLLELDTKTIIALNMVDVLEKKGIKIDINQLKNDLNTEVCGISALKQIGIKELINCIRKMANQKQTYHKLNCNNCEICIFKNNNDTKHLYEENKTQKYKFYKKNKNQEYKLYEESITQRYKFIEKITAKCLYKKKKWINITEMLDKIFLNKIFSFPIFVIIMFLVYFLSVGVVGKYTINLSNNIVQVISSGIEKILINFQISQWLQSLIINGAIKGITTVLTFIPQLIMLFICIAILETTGYMARIAFLLDNIFRKIGLSGKAIIPFIIGSGCSVPGIMSTKILENNEERKKVSILVPFIPCSAKLPIIVLFSSYFFKEKAGIISSLIYFFAIFIIILSSLIFKRYSLQNTNEGFVLELPDYKLPSIKYVARDVFEKTIDFIKRAGTTIFLSSIVIWFLLSFSTKLEYGVNLENSILASIGKKISWVFYPMLGVNSWQATISAMQGLIAKEQVISSMAIISGLENKEIFESQAFGFFNIASAISFVIFNLFSAPCISAISAMKKELGSFRKMFIAILFQTILAWGLAVVIYCLF